MPNPHPHRPIAGALLLALAAGAPVAWAQDAGDDAVNARIAQLEAQLGALLEVQSQQQARIAELEAAQPRPQALATREPEAEVEAEARPAVAAAPLPEGRQAIQSTTITPAATPGTTFRFGGFVKVDFLATRTGDGQLPDDATGRAVYIPGQTPVGGEASSVDYDSHAKFSRFGLGVDSTTDAGDRFGALVEMDFFGNALGNQVNLNSYGVTLRHAYMYWNGWLAGQTWSNFMDVASIPEAVDFVGPLDGLIFARQAQIRYTRDAFSIALENPETTVAGRPSSDRGALPDLTLRYGWSGEWGSFGVAGLARQLRIDTPEYRDTRFGGGLTVGGKWQLGANDSLHYQLTGGQGISRYVGLGISSDAALDPVAGNLDTTGLLAGYIGWRHAFGPQWRGHLIYARSEHDNDIALTGPDATRRVQSLRANLFYSPLPRLDLGVEVSYGQREVESGQEGDISRLHFTTKYSF